MQSNISKYDAILREQVCWNMNATNRGLLHSDFYHVRAIVTTTVGMQCAASFQQMLT